MTLVNTETGEVVSRESGWLASVDAATFELSQIERVDDAVALIDQAEVAKTMARNVLRSREATNHASHVSLLCQRRAGELLAETSMNPGGRSTADTLSVVLGVESDAKAQQLSSRWQRIAAIPEDVFTGAVAQITSKGEELTTAGLIRTATYSPPIPRPKPKRGSLTDAAQKAGWEFRKSVERIERLAADDRFAANREQVAAHWEGHLSYSIEVCQDLLKQLNQQS